MATTIASELDETVIPPPLDASLVDANVPQWRSPTDCGVAAAGWIHYWIERDTAIAYHHAASGRTQRECPPEYREVYDVWREAHRHLVNPWMMRGWGWFGAV